MNKRGRNAQLIFKTWGEVSHDSAELLNPMVCHSVPSNSQMFYRQELMSLRVRGYSKSTSKS
jgi:hypothetical protein